MPKFYNYENDKINFSYNDNDFDLLLNAIKDYELSSELEYCIQRYTNSRDGYIAFYSEHELKADKDLYIKVILETLSRKLDTTKSPSITRLLRGRCSEILTLCLYSNP